MTAVEHIKRKIEIEDLRRRQAEQIAGMSSVTLADLIQQNLEQQARRRQLESDLATLAARPINWGSENVALEPAYRESED